MAALDELILPLEGRFSIAEIARAAGMHPNHLHNVRAGRRGLSLVTVARVRLGIQRLKTRQAEGPFDAVVAYRAALALASLALGVDPAAAQVSDPARKQTQIKSWRDAANARRLGIYLMNTTLGFHQAHVARAAGVTKQSVNQIVQHIEEQRDEQDFEAVVVRLEGWILGAVM